MKTRGRFDIEARWVEAVAEAVLAPDSMCEGMCSRLKGRREAEGDGYVGKELCVKPPKV